MKQLLNIYLFLILVFSGCSGEDIGSFDQSDINKQTVILSFINGDHNDNTRSVIPGEESLNENLIERLDIFFFNQAGECLFYPLASQMSKTGGTVKIIIPKETSTILLNENFSVYIIANCVLSRDMLEGKTYNQLIETVQGVPQDFNPYPFSPQPYFLMDGILPVDDFTEESTDLGEVTLIRAASKIIINITGASISGYTPVEAHVRMDNYLETSAIGQEAPLYNAQKNEYKHSEYREIWIPGTTEAGFNTAPFYSYANNWEYGDSYESYITIRVKWYKDDGGAEPKNYYYHLPLSAIQSKPDSKDHYSLERNHIYTFNVNIGVLGGLDPDNRVDLTPNFEIKDWTTNRIVAKLNEYDYLAIAETDVQMHDITTRSIQYVSSKPVSVQIDSIFHYTYLASGEIRVDNIPQGDSRYPSIVANEANSSIDITSPVPINYVPVMMYFKAKNTAGLYYNVRVTQYPRQYITSKFSDKKDIDFQWYKEAGWGSFWSNNGEGSDNPVMKNFNLYTITTTSVDPLDDFMIGGSMMYNEYSATALDTIYVTKRDAATNKMVSPQFVIASQRGITSTSTPYSAAQVRCANYMEGTFDRGTWRIPTKAEMVLISKLQRDGNSAIKELFTPIANGSDGSDRWWTAYVEKVGSETHYHSVKVATGEVVVHKYVSGGPPTNSVRCVRDVWKN